MLSPNLWIVLYLFILLFYIIMSDKSLILSFAYILQWLVFSCVLKCDTGTFLSISSYFLCLQWQAISLTVIEKVQIAAAVLGSLFLIASISWLVWSSLSPSAKWQRQDLLFQICYAMYGFMDLVCIGRSSNAVFFMFACLPVWECQTMSEGRKKNLWVHGGLPGNRHMLEPAESEQDMLNYKPTFLLKHRRMYKQNWEDCIFQASHREPWVTASFHLISSFLCTVSTE